MRQYFILFVLAFSLTFNAFAGLVNEISTYLNAHERKIVILVGEIQIDAVHDAAGQWQSWEELFSPFSRLDRKGSPTFLIEGSVEETSLFNKLPVLLIRRGVPFGQPDNRAIVSDTLSRLRASQKNLPTMQGVLDALAQPLLEVNRDEVLWTHKIKWADTLAQVYKKVKSHKLFILDNDRLKIPLDELAKIYGHKTVAGVLTLLIDELSRAASSPEGEMIVDNFDLGSINFINNALTPSTFVHVAGTTHKKRMELMLNDLGYEKIADHKQSDPQASFDEYCRELNLMITAKHNGESMVTPAFMRHIEEEAKNLFLKYKERLSVKPEAFLEIDKLPEYFATMLRR